LAALIGRLTGFKGEIVWDISKADGVERKVLDVSRMEAVLVWKPPTSLEAGLSRTIQWYMENKAEADARP
jgi:GDP-L-fucose synthase